MKLFKVFRRDYEGKCGYKNIEVALVSGENEDVAKDRFIESRKITIEELEKYYFRIIGDSDGILIYKLLNF